MRNCNIDTFCNGSKFSLKSTLSYLTINNVFYQIGLSGYCVPYYSWEQLNPIEHRDTAGRLHTQLAHQCQGHNKGRHVCSERENIANNNCKSDILLRNLHILYSIYTKQSQIMIT